MKARNSSGVETSLPTSPISPPIEIVTPFGSRARMKRVKRAAFSKFCRCWRASVGWDMSTSVDVSMSMFRKPAGIASSMSASMARLSAPASVANFFAFIWKWSPWMKTEPRCPSLIAAGDLEDEGAHVARLRRAEDGARGIVREHAEVDGRRREPARLSAPHRHVELLDGGGQNAESRGGLPDAETRLVAPRGVGVEDGASHESVDRAVPKAGGIPLHLCQDVLDGHGSLQEPRDSIWKTDCSGTTTRGRSPSGPARTRARARNRLVRRPRPARRRGRRRPRPGGAGPSP